MYKMSWTLADGRRVENQLFTAEAVSGKLLELESWRARDIKLEMVTVGTEVRIKSSEELSKMGWCVDDMLRYSGKVTRISYDLGDGYFILQGCDEFQWASEGFETVEEV